MVFVIIHFKDVDWEVDCAGSGICLPFDEQIEDTGENFEHVALGFPPVVTGAFEMTKLHGSIIQEEGANGFRVAAEVQKIFKTLDTEKSQPLGRFLSQFQVQQLV